MKTTSSVPTFKSLNSSSDKFRKSFFGSSKSSEKTVIEELRKGFYLSTIKEGQSISQEVKREEKKPITGGFIKCLL